MKLSIAVASSEAPPSAFVVWRGFESSIKKAADLGYHGVELALKNADEINPNELDRWLSQSNLEVSCISTGQVFSVLGLYFTNPNKDHRQETVRVFQELVGLAKDFGQMINLGRVRGFIADDQTPEEAEELFIDTLRRIGDLADQQGVTLVVEPVNRYEINFINNLDQGVRLLEKANRNNLGLMPDLFHMNIEDAQMGDSLVRHADWIKYIHLADSNRHAPGQGHLDFDDVFAGLKRMSYTGWTSIEILPIPDPDTAARQAEEFILPRIERNS